MDPINFKRTLDGTVAGLVAELTELLKEQGFGIMSRIDLHAKIHAQLGKEIPETVILGACHPQLAYDAYTANTDVASLLPCNAVVRDLGEGRVSVELVKPSALLRTLGDKKLDRLANDADHRLKRVLEHLRPTAAPSH